MRGLCRGRPSTTPRDYSQSLPTAPWSLICVCDGNQLRGYGEDEAAEDLQIELDEVRRREQEPRRAVTVRYRGRDLTEDEETAVRVFIETVIARNR